MPRYTRVQVAAKLTELGCTVSASTIYRWEKSNRVPGYTKPKRLAHNGELLYTDEHIAMLRAFMEQTVDSDSEKIPSTSETARLRVGAA